MVGWEDACHEAVSWTCKCKRNLLTSWQFGRWNFHNHYIKVMLQYYMKHPSCNKFNYDHTNSKCIDENCIYFYSDNVTNKIYTLDRVDVEELEKFVTERMYRVYVGGLCSHTDSYGACVVFSTHNHLILWVNTPAFLWCIWCMIL